MRSRSWDLAAACALALAAAAALVLGTGASAPRLALTLPLVFFAPGYALTSALFLPRALRTEQTLLLSLGLSLALAVGGGFILNLTSMGLRSSTWTVLLAGITLAAAGVALARRARHGADGDAAPHFFLDVGQVLSLGLAGVLVLAALGVARASAEQQSQTGFTQLWLVPSSGDHVNLQLGVRSEEPAVTTYRVRLEVGGRVVKEWPSIKLEPNTAWQATTALSPAPPRDATVRATLYRSDQPGVVYRHVELAPPARSG